MVLISGLKSTTIWKAFLLNSIASSLIIFVALTIKSNLDIYNSKDGYNKSNNTINLIITLIITFIASYMSYTLLYVIFGYGYGMMN